MIQTFQTDFWKFYHKGRFSKNMQKCLNISTYCNFRPP